MAITHFDITTNTSDGVRFFKFSSSDGLKLITKENDNAAKVIYYTPDGSFFALSDGTKISLRNADTNSEILPVEEANISRVAVSPEGKYLCTFTPFKKTPEFPDGQPNLNVYEVSTGKLIDSRTHIPTETWRPQWSSDAKLCVRVFQGEIQFYPDDKLDEKPAKRLCIKGMRHCSLAKSPRNRHLAVYSPSEKSEPAAVNLYAWRDGACVPVANKSFFRADSVSLHWSDLGTSLLVLASTKMSKESYYGDTMLHFLTTTKSGDSATVPMPRAGPIHQVLWRPSPPDGRPADEQFIVCHGSMPASVLVYNIKCEKVQSLGSGAWNQVHFNPQGTLLLAAGFGNLDGNGAVWNLAAPPQRRLVCEFSARNTSSLAWLPDGEHFVTAITTPRLRVDNGWTIWHYTGRPIAHERVEKRANPRPATVDLPSATEHELYQVLVRPLPFDRLPPPPTVSTSAADKSSAKQAPAAIRLEKPKAYVPPSLRNMSSTAEHARNVASGRPNRNLRSTAHFAVTDPAAAAAASAALRGGNGSVGGIAIQSGDGKQGGKNAKKKQTMSENDEALTAQDQANKKQIAYIKKKLGEIEKLKNLQKTTKLEPSQVEKIKRESELRKQLSQLTL